MQRMNNVLRSSQEHHGQKAPVTRESDGLRRSDDMDLRERWGGVKVDGTVRGPTSQE
jgi:hypothetical protein